MHGGAVRKLGNGRRVDARQFGKLFEAQSWLSLACGIVVLMGARDEDGTATMGWARGAVEQVLKLAKA